HRSRASARVERLADPHHAGPCAPPAAGPVRACHDVYRRGPGDCRGGREPRVNAPIRARVPIRRVAVIGAGTMGHGIAYAALAAGHDVALADADRDALLAAHERIAGSFDAAISRGKATAESRDAALARLTTHPDLESAASGADLVIEAVPERIELKRALFLTAQAAAP